MKRLLIILLSVAIVYQSSAHERLDTEEKNLLQKAINLAESVNTDLVYYDLGYVWNSFVHKYWGGYRDAFTTRIIQEQETKFDTHYKAIKYCQIFAYRYPQSKYLSRALIAKAKVELAMGRQNDAKNTFHRLLYAGVDIPALIKINGCNDRFTSRYTTDAFMAEHNYPAALQCLDSLEKYSVSNYGYQCAIGIYLDFTDKTDNYIYCYIQLNDTTKAIEALMPFVIKSKSVLFYDNLYSESLCEMLLDWYSKKELKKMYRQAFENYTTEIEIVDGVKDEQYYIKFAGAKIELVPRESDTLSHRDIQAIYRESYLYTLLY